MVAKAKLGNWTFGLIVLALGSPLFAQENQLFNCQLAGSEKSINVTEEGEAFVLTFGPADDPELRVKEPINSDKHRPWNGIGRTVWEILHFNNSGHQYELTIGIDNKDAVENPTNFRVVQFTVFKEGEKLAALACDLASVEYEVFSFYDRITE